MSNVSDIPVPQARYSLLHNKRKNCAAFRNRFIVAGLLLIVASCISLSVYIATIGIYDQVLYPKNNGKKDIPSPWISRAILYNIINYKNSVPTKEIAYRKSPTADTFKLVCYYNFPSEKSVKGDFSKILLPSNIDPNLCTHINVGFASVVNNSIHLTAFQLGVAKSVIKLKVENPKLKVLLSIGGAGNQRGFPEMVANHESRKRFIKSVDLYVRHYRFDGVDLDWEFPNRTPLPDKRQKIHFSQLLHEIRSEIDRQDKHKFLLTVAVAAPPFLVDECYSVPFMNEQVDFINLMSYDFHFYTKMTPFTGLNAPLYSKSFEVAPFSQLNINYTAYYWNAKGIDKNKIVVGLPTYGHSFKLLNPHNNGVLAPAQGYGTLGSNGFIDFNEACWFLTKNQVNPIFDTETKSPYATKYTEWFSYDDQISLTFKAEFIKNHNFGGAMVLSLNTDDHAGLCKVGGKVAKFPLTNQIKTILNDQQL